MMLGQTSRAEALAVVALVVGARRDVVVALRQFAAEDQSLLILKQVAAYCEQGLSLPEALRKSRLLTRRDAERLMHMEPTLLADELGRLAQRRAIPNSSDLLAKWLPVWLVLAASVPNLLIGLAVAVITGTFYISFWEAFGYGYMHARHQGSLWLLQFGGTLIAAIMAGFLWALIRKLFTACHLAIFSRSLERATLLVDLLQRLRSGDKWLSVFKKWQWMSGDRRSVRTALNAAGGDGTAALIALGIIPKTDEGKPDWECACAEAKRIRDRESNELVPWMVTILLAVGLFGFFTWGVGLLVFDGNLWTKLFISDFSIQALLKLFYQVTALVVGLILSSAVRSVAIIFLNWIAGPGRDWEIVADRIARALDRRENLTTVLRGLRFAVHGPMRRRIDRALESDEGLPGTLLIKSGMVPAAFCRVVAHASDVDLAAVLRSSSAIRDDYGVRTVISQAKPALALLVVIAPFLFYLHVGILPKYEVILRSISGSYTLVSQLNKWAIYSTDIVLMTVALAMPVMAFGTRRGWWIAIGGWARVTRGLVLRRLLSEGRNERELADALQSVSPRDRIKIDQAASNGDLSGVLSAAGWQVQNATELDRAIAAHLTNCDRRRERLALALRLIVPFVIAVPIGLSSVSVMLFVTGSQSRMTAEAKHPGAAGLTGSSPGQVILFWWTERIESQSNNVLDEVQKAEKDFRQSTLPAEADDQ